MRLLLGFTKILYKILDISENDVPIVITDSDTHFSSHPKDTTFYLNVKVNDLEEVLQLGRMVYIIHSHLTGSLEKDILSKNNLDERTTFESKIEQEAISFSQLFATVTCDVMLEKSDNEGLKRVKEALFQPYNIYTHNFDNEFKDRIQKELDEAYNRMKDKYYKRMLELKDEITSSLFL